MTFALRNSLIILVLIIILGGIGLYVVFYKVQSEVQEVKSEFETKNEKLILVRESNIYFDAMENMLNIHKIAWNEIPKQIYEHENNAISFAYINNLAKQRNSLLFYEYSSKGFQKIFDTTIYSDTITVSRYTIIGDALFEGLYNFIWKIENYAPLYVIESLTINPVGETDKPYRFGITRVDFSMDISCFSIDRDDLDEQESISPGEIDRVNFSPFYALIKLNLPDNDENLPTVENLTLQGFTQSKALLRDSNNNSHILKVGDAVFLGHLTRIIPEENAVEFTLNEGGFIRRVKIKMFQKK